MMRRAARRSTRLVRKAAMGRSVMPSLPKPSLPKPPSVRVPVAGRRWPRW